MYKTLSPIRHPHVTLYMTLTLFVCAQIKAVLDDILEKLADEFNMIELSAKVPPDERTPYTIVAVQECERMNTLTNEMKRSLKELNLGLKVSAMCRFVCRCS